MRVKNNRFSLKRIINRYDGEGGGAAGAGAESGSETTTSTATQTQPATATDPQTEPEAKPFKTFESQSDYDREIQQVLKTREGNMREEIKGQLEKESKMTAEQLAQQQLQTSQKEIEDARADIAKERNRLSAERQFVVAGIDEKAYNTILDTVVSADKGSTDKAVKSVISIIQKQSESIANEKVKSAMADAKPPEGSAGESKKPETDMVKELYGKDSENAKKAKTAYDYYSAGGKK
ncbi:MAG: DUF4355 domain-containing protein [Oscillospiraceae bacterium]|nr:DUF4355 domain-containing protein [Oscillospiraceae bacterium]